MLRCYFILLYLIIFSSRVSGQQRSVQGTVKSDGGEKLVAAIITLVNQKGTVLKYAGTDEKGGFSLNMPVSREELWLEVSYFGYHKERLKIESDRNIYDFILATDPIGLKEVKIKNAPVVRQGDTLSYHVESFATEQDRSIGDVLRRMPGIEIASDGAIYHNGEKIQNLYIHGDNLMEGRYGLATKAIRREMIVRVDVIQNHQPVNVLRDKVRSDKTSLNLVLKDENSLKLSGKMMLGGGLPGQADVSLSPILLNKRIKMLNMAGFNNAGVDFKADFRQLGNSGLSSETEHVQPQVSLSQGTAGPPDLPLKNYYFNRSGILNLNNSFTTAKGMQFRLNMQGFTDKNTLNYDAVQENYLEKDTLVYREHQALRNKSRMLNVALNSMVNKKNYFFNNRLKISLSRSNGQSTLGFNNRAFKQRMDKYLYNFSNDLNWIPALKNKGIAEFRWMIGKNTDSQRLGIGKGYISDFMGTGSLDSVRQQVSLPAFISDVYLSYKLAGTVLTQDYKLGYAYEALHLDTRLDYWENNDPNHYPGDVGNDLRWKRDSFYFLPTYQLKAGRWWSQVDFPLSLQKIKYRQSDYHLNETHFKPLFTPKASLRYDFSQERRLTARYSFNRALGNITHIYRGAVLQNYRVLQANNAGLQEGQTHSAALNYEYQRSAKMLFANIGGFYNKTSANTLASTVLEGNVQKTVLLDYPNFVSNTGLNGGVSKYLFGPKATVGLKGNWSLARFEQIINGDRQPFDGNTLALRASLNRRFLDRINLVWQPVFNGFVSSQKNETQARASHRSYRISQEVNLGIEFMNNVLWEITATHSYSRQSNSREVKYFFLDSRLRYGNRKKKADVSLELVNLLNIRDYTLYSLYSNQLMMNHYTLRGRMVNLRADFYF